MLFSSLLRSTITSINGLPIYARIPQGALVPAISNLGNNWVLNTTLGNRLVLGTPAPNATATTTGVPTGSKAFTLGYSGDHSGIGSSGTQQRSIYTNLNTSQAWTGIMGGHTHTVSLYYPAGGSGYIPVTKCIGLFSYNNADSILPGSIIFSNTKPEGNFTLYTGFDNQFLASATSSAQIGTTIGSTSFAMNSATSSSAGSHYHNTGTTVYKTTQTGWTNPPPTGYFDNDPPTQSGSHTHAVTGSFSYTVADVVQLKPWLSNSVNNISSGCILLWNSTSTTLPPGWVFCDGSTVRGVTTPNLNRSKILKVSSSATNGTYVSGTNSISLTATAQSTTVTHSHLGGVVSQYYFTTGSIYHSYGNWTHSHTATASVVQNPATISLSFIMYIP